MGQALEQFWNAVHRHWTGGDPEQEDRAVRAALKHFRRRLPGRELQHLQRELPREIRALWAEPELDRTRRHFIPLEKQTFEGFLESVAHEAGLSGVEEAERVTTAVFHALSRFISGEERAHLVYQLPAGLKERWSRAMHLAVRARHGASGAYGPGGG